MRKNSLETAILAGALVVFLALPSLASAGQVVPPGNSAATQYTQVFPTSGGNVSVGKSIGEPGGSDKPPAKVIGKKTTEELESQGPEGKAVAELAAESAPTPETQPEGGESSGGGQGSGHQQAAAGGNGNGSGGSKPGPGGSGNGGGSPAQGQPSAGAAATDTAASEAAESGSSGVSEVLGQATGSTSGEMGVFLPLVLLGALALALVYAWRRRQHEPKAAP